MLFPDQPADFHWDPALVRRARVLLHTGPLHDLRAGDARVDEDRRHYDSLLLAMRVMDLIVENAGLETEVDSEAVNRALEPLLCAMDEAAGMAPDAERHRLAIDRVLGGLRNDEDRRRPFSAVYQDFDENGKAVLRRFQFWLVQDHFHASGRTVLRLSTEATNLYLNALELDIEDAQTAAEAVLESQLARGKFDEAVQSARNARLQSLRYDQKIEGLLRDTRRDLRRVDWKKDAPRMLAEALEHIRVRLETEQSILTAAEERLDALAASESARKVAEVADLVRDCRSRHMDLHHRLMGARNVFLDEQARQSFTPAPALTMPSLEAEVLEPVLRMRAGQAREAVDFAFPLWFGARAAPMFSLVDLALWQLRPRREQGPAQVMVGEADLAPGAADVPRFPPALREAADRLFAGIQAPATLSALLQQAPGAGTSPQLVALYALNEYAAEGTWRVEKLTHEKLHAPGFEGDELLIHPVSADAA